MGKKQNKKKRGLGAAKTAMKTERNTQRKLKNLREKVRDELMRYVVKKRKECIKNVYIKLLDDTYNSMRDSGCSYILLLIYHFKIPVKH